MKIIKHLNDYWVAYIILITIGLLVYLFIGGASNDYSSYRMMALEQENQKLSRLNSEIELENQKIKERITETNRLLEQVNYRDSILRVKSDSISQKLATIKTQYENLKNRFDNFDNDSIHKYFSNL